MPTSNSHCSAKRASPFQSRLAPRESIHAAPAQAAQSREHLDPLVSRCHAESPGIPKAKRCQRPNARPIFWHTDLHHRRRTQFSTRHQVEFFRAAVSRNKQAHLYWPQNECPGGDLSRRGADPQPFGMANPPAPRSPSTSHRSSQSARTPRAHNRPCPPTLQ